MSIVLEHLTKSYGAEAIVRDLSLEIATGELFVLLGPSGSGKSTLLRIIAGLTDCESGRVQLHGRDVTRVPPQKRGIGFVFQNYALFRHMTVADNVEFALRVRKVRHADRVRRRDDLLEMVGLSGYADRRPTQLSGGQQQRVALARALAHAPEVLLLDEPFGALDARIRAELRATVKRIQRELGVTTIFVTHDQEEAFELGDRIAVLNHGRLLECGTPAELYLHPVTEFTAAFLGTANLVVGERNERGVRIGAVDIPVAAAPPGSGESSRVQLLFRPEDVAVKDSRDALEWPSLGEGTVESRSFVGAFERLRLRLPLHGARVVAPAAPFGSDYVVIDAVRPQHLARRFPLTAGDRAWVGLRRVHALAHPGMAFLVAYDPIAGDDESVVDLAGALARRARARLTLLWCGVGKGETDAAFQSAIRRLSTAPLQVASHRCLDSTSDALASFAPPGAFDLLVLSGAEGTAVEKAASALRKGDYNVLLVPGRAAVPSKILIAVTPGEPGKRGIRFVGRLARHLDASVTVLTVVSADAAGASAQEQAERFLAASTKTLAALAIPVTSRLRQGDAAFEIRAETQSGGHDLLVLGAPLGLPGRVPHMEGPVRELLGIPELSVLIVRTTGGSE